MKRGGGNNNRGGKRGASAQSTPVKKPVDAKAPASPVEGSTGSEDLKKKAAQIFSCGKAQIFHFADQVDPFNPGNVLEGYQCRQDGAFFGSLLLTAVNGKELTEPEVIYGTPKIEALPPRPPISPSPVSFYLANKWNGLNVLFFKYHDAAGNVFISCKTRGYVFARDYPGGKVFSNPLKVLGYDAEAALTATSPIIVKDKLPAQLSALKDAEVQSVSFELCGNDEPSLVKYNFDVSLVPIFTTSPKGVLRPVLAAEALKEVKPIATSASFDDRLKYWQSDVGPRAIAAKTDASGSKSDLALYIGEFTKESLRLNDEFRAKNKLDLAYYFQSFAIEGKIVYLLDDKGNALSREHVFKLKPTDIELSHAPMFDYSMQAKTIEALSKLHSRNIAVTEASIKNELGFAEREWIRFGKDVMELVEGIPNASSPSFKPSAQIMIMLVGIPGSGKSTFAKRLIDATGDIWVRVDEMGTRQACEAVARTAFKKGFSVIVDRVNFDIKQRNNWVKLASEFHVNNIRCLFLDTPVEVAKERILAREDHPTIPKGTTGPAIIDKFTKYQMNPTAGEGFCEIIRAKTEAEIDSAFEKFKGLIELEVLEDGWSSGNKARGRGPNLKKSSQIDEDEDTKSLNSSGGQGKSKAKPGREGKAPEVVAFNPYDMLNGGGGNDSDNESDE